jgi:hypothetical protein
MDETDFMTIQELKEKNLWETRYISAIGLIPKINNIDNDEILGLEIGVCRGENIIKIIESCKKIKTIDGVDPYKPYHDPNGGLGEVEIKKMFEVCEKNLKEYGQNKINLHVMTSIEFSHKVPNQHYDYIFIDGDHSQEEVYKDMVSWYPKLKTNGIFSGHDIHLQEVQKALRNFMIENNIKKNVYTCQHSVWWFKK